MQKKILSILAIALCAIVGSCKHPPSKEPVDKSKQHQSNPAANQSSDILEYKTKEENHQKDSLNPTFKRIILEKTATFEYELKINVETKPSNLKFYKDYYVILAIYPEDDKIGLLAPDRKKYGFESFSAKFVKNKNNKLVIRRGIKTKIKFARAITLSVMEFRNNKKTQVLIMQNVPL